MVVQAKRGPDASGRGATIGRALALVAVAGIVGAGCQLVVDGDRYSFTFEAPSEGAIGNHSAAGDAGPNALDDAGRPGDDDETVVVAPPVCDGCSIGDECVPAGAHSPSNDCELCDPSRDASAWSNRDGTCDDGLYCTVDDRCAHRRCSGAPRACDDDVACNGISRCDEENDQCSTGESQCPPGQVCDVAADTCTTTCAGCAIEGICVPEGTERAGNPCLVCQPGTSDTAYTSAPGKACGEAASECSDVATCDVAAVCQPRHRLEGSPCGNDATSICGAHDACDGSGHCTQRSQPDGTPCPDASFCSSDETCQGGVCRAASVTSCPGGQVCDPSVDACRCGGGQCFIGGTCVASGTTVPQNVCFVCDPAQNPGGYSPNIGAACGNPASTVCDAPDSCDAFGTCQPNFVGSDTLCSFGGECRAPSNCDGNGGCPFIPDDSASCDDGIFCNGIERCEGGVCQPGRPRPGCIEP